MKPTEVTQLWRLVKACCPSQVFDEFTPLAWAEVLASYSYDDAKRAVLQLVATPLEPGRSRYIEPGHIIGVIHRMRSQRLTDATPTNPPSNLSAAEYTNWLRQQRAAIAAGKPADPEPVHPADPARIRQLLSDATPRQLPRPDDGAQADASARDVELQPDDKDRLNAELARRLDALQTRIAHDQAQHGAG